MKVIVGLLMFAAEFQRNWMGFIPLTSGMSAGWDAGTALWYVISVWLIYSGARPVKVPVKKQLIFRPVYLLVEPFAGGRRYDFRRRRLFSTTETLDNAMAADAIMGESVHFVQ